jgi:hypothetical protein
MLITLFFLFLVEFVSHGQAPDQARLDSLFNALERNDLGSGGITIATGGKTIYQRSFGMESGQSRIPGCFRWRRSADLNNRRYV